MLLSRRWSRTSLQIQTAAMCVCFQRRRVRHNASYVPFAHQRVASLTLDCNGVFAIEAHSDSSLLPRQGAAIRDFRFWAELWFLGYYLTHIFVLYCNVHVGRRRSMRVTTSSRQCYDPMDHCAGSRAASSRRCVRSTSRITRSTNRNVTWRSAPGHTTRPRWTWQPKRYTYWAQAIIYFSHRRPCWRFMARFASKRVGGRSNITHCCKSHHKTTAKFSSNVIISFSRKSTRKDR